jgi:hypothetical protein
MRRRDQWIEWIRAVERESDTAAYALELLQEQLRREPSSLKNRGLGQRDYLEFAQNREATYLVRLFAESSRCRMPNERVSDAHLVRVYRNSIVHDESEPATPLSLAEARRFLCRFFSFLPEHW